MHLLSQYFALTLRRPPYLHFCSFVELLMTMYTYCVCRVRNLERLHRIVSQYCVGSGVIKNEFFCRYVHSHWRKKFPYLPTACKSRANFLIMHADLAVLPRVTLDEFNEQENAPASLLRRVCVLERTNPEVCINIPEFLLRWTFAHYLPTHSVLRPFSDHLFSASHTQRMLLLLARGIF